MQSTEYPVALSLAGHDKGGIFAVVGYSGGMALTADGRRRKLGKPKRKNQKHLRTIGSIALPKGGETDRMLRTLLREYSAGAGRTGGGM
jgi:hypothetical protein